MLDQMRLPVVCAPMAGGPSTPELAAAVTTAGGLGVLAGGYLTPEALQDQLVRTAELTDGPMAVNVFVPGTESGLDVDGYRRRLAASDQHSAVQPGEPRYGAAADDRYEDKLELLLDNGVPMVSFTFGLPTAVQLRRLHQAGAIAVATVTTPEEAGAAAALGVDALCVQGIEAGGHRGCFGNDPELAAGGEAYGLLTLLELVRQSTELPLLAAGGIAHPRQVAGVLAAGAVAAQVGTAYLRTAQAGTNPTYRAALAETNRGTILTRAFSGRPARGLRNGFITAHDAAAPAAYPQVNDITKPIRAAAARAGNPEDLSLWAGQCYPLAAAEGTDAGELTRWLAPDEPICCAA